MDTKRTFVAVVVNLLKHRTTYRFLAVVLIAFGVLDAKTVMGTIETLACAFLGCIG